MLKMTPSHKKRKKSKPLPIAVIVAVITGAFAMLTALITVVPTWISAIRQSPDQIIPFFTPTATWPVLPIITEPLPASEKSSPVQLNNIEVVGFSSYFKNVDAGVASNVPPNQRMPATYGPIFISFDATSFSTSQWIILENHVFIRIDSIQSLPSQERQNILLPGNVGGFGIDTNFYLTTKGTIGPGDILETPPSTQADYFTLQPGEIMRLKIESNWDVPSGLITVTPGMVYTYNGERHTIWLNTSFSFISTTTPIFWKYKDGKWIADSP